MASFQHSVRGMLEVKTARFRHRETDVDAS